MPPKIISYLESPLYLTYEKNIQPIIPNIEGETNEFSINPQLPLGMNLNPKTGEISGSINSLPYPSYTITVSNDGGSTNFSFQIYIKDVVRDWGLFTDMFDGTIKVNVTQGTFGGQTYSTKTLFFSKCSYGETYEPLSNSCIGTPLKVIFCNTLDNSCNGNNPQNTLDSGQLFNACNNFRIANKSGWRVPTKNELKLISRCDNSKIIPNDLEQCSTKIQSINILFMNGASTKTYENYWTSNTVLVDNRYAWIVYFGNQFGATNNGVIKNSSYGNYVRCVTSE